MNYEDFRKANKKVSGFLSNEKYLGQIINGFVPVGTTIPNYWYIIGKEKKT